MAYAIVIKSSVPPFHPVAFPHRQTLADQTATTTATTGAFGDLVTTGRLYFLVAKIKTKALTGTRVYSLETADNTGFSTARREIASNTQATASILGTTGLYGWSDETTNQFYRIVATFGTSGTFDVEVMAMPML